MQQNSQRLAAYCILQSTRADEASEFLAGHDFDLRIDARDRSPLRARINCATLRHISICDVSYGRAIEIRATPSRTDFWLQIPTHHHFNLDVGCRRIHCDASTGAILSPQQENVVHATPHCRRLALSMSRAPLIQTLSAMLDKPLTAPLEFQPAVDLTSGYGLSLARHVLAAVEDLEQGESLLSHPIQMRSFEEFIYLGFLLSQRHNYSDALLQPAPRVASRDVKRAIDFIEANLASPITLADIIGAAAVSGRALFRHFKHFTGASPMQYLRDARFRQVRQALLETPPEQRVCDIAAHWGFDHMGRFSRDYRRRFGESPSDTRRRHEN